MKPAMRKVTQWDEGDFACR